LGPIEAPSPGKSPRNPYSTGSPPLSLLPSPQQPQLRGRGDNMDVQ
jgi:hypothetical protein